MNHQRISLATEGAFLDTYFLNCSDEILHSDRHPAVVICPGGAYLFLSERETEPIALALAARGFSTAVLRYPCAPARFPAQLCAAAEAVAWVRSHAAESHIDPDRISIAGFSAGGHLAASLGVFWNRPFLAESTGLQPQQMRPDRLLLCYPVITGGEFLSEQTFRCLLGDDFADPEKRAFVSLETQVTSQTPPTFLWHTVTDAVVPVENSMLFAMSLRKAGVPFEAHLFSVGPHGLALANDLTESPEHLGVEPACTGWLDLAVNWLRR